MKVDRLAVRTSQSHQGGPDAPKLEGARYRGSVACDSAMPLHLLRLVSQSLPIGAFSYSRGLEPAIYSGWVKDETAARDWILGMLENVFAVVDGALFWRMLYALRVDDMRSFSFANAWLAACRESRELQAEDRRMGEAFVSLLRALDVPAVKPFEDEELTYAAGFAIAAHHWGVTPTMALRGLMWAVVESQVAAAVRLVPLGQVAAQRILINAVPVIERSAALAAGLDDHKIGNVSPALAMASAWHETQYSRLFRS